jgi:hypothetical protein
MVWVLAPVAPLVATVDLGGKMLATGLRVQYCPELVEG